MERMALLIWCNSSAWWLLVSFRRETKSLMVPTCATTLSTWVPALPAMEVTVPTELTVSVMSALISAAAVALRVASMRTSDATTAKPRPCSPALAASTAALRARMLVWKAMESITPVMSAIFRLISPTVSICTTRSRTDCPPFWAPVSVLRATSLTSWEMRAWD